MSSGIGWSNALRIIVVAAALLIDNAIAPAAEISGITVAGTGEARAKPTFVEINATVSGDAELAADAVVKYRDAKKKALKAIDGLKIASLTVDSNGYSVGEATDPNQQMAMMQGRAPNPGKQKVLVAEQLRLVLKDADKVDKDLLMDTVLKVLDTARDAGLTIGPPTPGGFAQIIQMQMGGGQNTSLVAFKAADPAGVREQAYKQAMDDARKKAQHLADLAGVKLGPIVAVHEGMPPKDQENNNYLAMMMALAGGNGGEREPASTNLSEIPMKVALTVQFEIQK